MDIFLTVIDTGELLQFPMLPEKIACKTAAAFQSYNIIGSGEVKFPLGEEPTGFSWSGVLPGLARGAQPYIKTRVSPISVQEKLSSMRVNGLKLRLLVTETPINHDVYLESYATEYSGAYGDISYEIAFVVAKDIVISTVLEKRAAAAGNGSARPAVKKKTYSVRAGDTLWKIAQAQMGDGAKYPQLYAANKRVIDAGNANRSGSAKVTAKRTEVIRWWHQHNNDQAAGRTPPYETMLEEYAREHGLQSVSGSVSKYTIYPGQELTIP